MKSVSIQIGKKSSEPLYIQIYNEIRKLIMEDYYVNNERLPSIRALSNQLGVNTVTVINAYRLLQNDGFAEIKTGSGTYVKKRELKVISTSPESISDELYTSEDIELMNKGKIDINAAVVNFATTTPSPDIFPLEDFKRVIIETIDSDGAEAFNYQESLGFIGLREIISKKFFSEETSKKMSNIQIISGAQQGIDIVAKALLGQDDCVVVERPTYVGANAVFESRGAKIISVDIKSDGMDMEDLASVMRKYRPKIIYTIPTYHNPTGYIYSLEKRKELLRLAAAFGSYIIEDDYLSELNYYGVGNSNPATGNNQAIRTTQLSLKKMDTNDCTIFVKSFSKLLMPGLRIGFMVVPDHLMERINSAKRATDISTSGLIQRAFFRYIESGLWEKHLDRIMKIYKKRYELMLLYLEDMKKYGVKFTQPGGGFNFWVKLPMGMDANELYYHTAKRGVVFIPGSVFSYGRSSVSANYARLSFAQTDEADIKYGMTVLDDYIEKSAKGYRSANSVYPLV
ncbi:MAG TPA: PLP-dependent aminotransferase family protein [Clostridiaceae bacterium]|nr:PLP-dependent aminotransferase family protein [Clostridiaceae bacterium]